MAEWNVVVTLRGRDFNRSMQLLRPFGRVQRSPYFNLLLLTVEDPRAFLDALHARAAQDPRLAQSVAHAVPLFETFPFTSPEEFERRAIAAVRPLGAGLGGRSFYVRVHRRGFKGRLHGHEEEKRLGEALLAAMADAGAPGSVSFDAPDFVMLVESVGQRAGFSVWTRAQAQRYPFLPLGPSAAVATLQAEGEPPP